MLNRFFKTLLAPVDAGGGAAVAEAPEEAPPNITNDWISGLGSIDGAVQPVDNPPVQTKKESADAAKPSGSAAPVGDPASPQTPAEKRAAVAAAAKAEEDQRAAAATKTATAAEKEAAEKVAKEKADAEAKATAEKEKDEKWPRSSADWDKFKKNRREEQLKYEGEIKTRDQTISTLQAQLKEVQEKGAKAPEVSPEVTKENESLKKENEEMSNRLRILEVTNHPRFQAHFEGKRNAQIEMAKRIVGPEKAPAVEKLLKLPDIPEISDWKAQQVAEFISDLDPLQTSRIGTVLNALDEINSERDKAIAENKTYAEQITTQTTEQQKANATKNAQLRDKVWNDALATIKDDKLGMAVYQMRDGDEPWNTGVNARIVAAKRFLFGGKDVKPQELAKAALDAAALPAVLEAYQADMKEGRQKIAELEEQVKKLTAAQPGARNGSGSPAGDGGQARTTLKDGMTPFEASRAFAESIVAAGREG